MPDKTQALEHFTATLEQHTEDMLDFVNAGMKNDGDTEETSQRICVLNALYNLESVINGTTDDDLVKQETV